MLIEVANRRCLPPRSPHENLAKSMSGHVLHLTVVSALVFLPSSIVSATDWSTAEVSPFLKQHCVSCHSGATPEGNLNLATDSVDLNNAELLRRWVYLHDRVTNGEMPPAAEEQPDSSEKHRFLKALAEQLTLADRASQEVVLRRLNRNEYQNTVCDLFGIEIDLHNVLPDDAPDQGFDTTGSALSISAEQMMLYLDAAELVMEEVFGPDRPPEPINKTVNIKELRSNSTADRIDDDGVVLFSGAKSLPMYGLSVRGPARYRLRIQAKAIQAERPVIMRVEGGVTGRIPGHVAGFFEVPPGELTTIELTDRAVESSDTFAFGLVDGFPWWSVDPDKYQGEGLFLGDITIEGPLEEWPRQSRLKLLGAVDPATATIDDIRQILSQTLPGIFRRSTTEEELVPFVDLSQQALADGEPFDVALRRGLKGMLCAPEFLFLEEPFNATPETADKISDFALASRLSYFLWSSLPDDELLRLARQNTLHQPNTLHTQVERMLVDVKSQRFVENFTGQWLRLREIDFTVPDPQLYPEYDQLLRQSMLDETHAFFREILDRDHSVQTFLDSDFAMLNRPMAEFYGMPEMRGLEMQRVSLPADSIRGGILTHASVLKVSADGTRTSPVLRGSWVLKNLFGSPPPPPPSSVSAIEPDIRGATTIREQLAKHRSHESCSRCHNQIDPPGFALEQFDVIGGERTFYRMAQGGQQVSRPLHPEAPNQSVRYRRGLDVDCSGVLADGRTFADIREYRKLLCADETALPRALTKLLLTYSIGRTPGFSDRSGIERVMEATKESHYGLRSLIHQVVQSSMFRQP
ncbi:MAG: DUF1592 domain-containing protein [Planctomycetaceae bacterium]|nr:DUF1592 domain-containing protein [Planctomycetaceae bacterium]